MKFLKNKFAPIAISIFIGIGLIVGINFLLAKINGTTAKTNNEIANQHNYQAFNKNTDQDVIKFYKERTVSLAIIKSENEKINGTAWLKHIDTKTNTYSFVTNLHVIASFVVYNETTKQLSFNNNFSQLNIHYFDTYESTETFIERTNELNWSIGKNVIMQKRVIPNNYEYLKKDNIERSEEDGMVYINNGYIDYIELNFKPNKNTSNNFNEWLKRVRQLDPNQNFISAQDLQLAMQKNDFELFIAGFPLFNGKIDWIEQKVEFKRKNQNQPNPEKDNLLEISSTPEVIGVNPWLDINEKFSIKTLSNKIVTQRNIASQLLVKDLIMGNGTSGSMISMKLNNQIKIIGIWWGTYGNRVGACDILWTNSYIPHDSVSEPEWNNIEWSGYNLFKN